MCTIAYSVQLCFVNFATPLSYFAPKKAANGVNLITRNANKQNNSKSFL